MELEKWHCLLRCPRRHPHQGPRMRHPQGSGRRAPLTPRRHSVCVLVLMEESVRVAVRMCLTRTTPSALVTFTADACTSNRYAACHTYLYTHITNGIRKSRQRLLHLAVLSVTCFKTEPNRDNMNVLLQVLSFNLCRCSQWTLTQCVRVWLALRICVRTADGLHICCKMMTNCSWSLSES